MRKSIHIRRMGHGHCKILEFMAESGASNKVTEKYPQLSMPINFKIMVKNFHEGTLHG